MRRRIMGNLRFDTPAKRDSFKSAFEAKIANIDFFEKAISHGEVEGIAGSNIDLRTENPVEADKIFDFLKDKVGIIPWLSGVVSLHNCSHDEGSPQPCKIEEQFEKV